MILFTILLEFGKYADHSFKNSIYRRDSHTVISYRNIFGISLYEPGHQLFSCEHATAAVEYQGIILKV